MGFAKRNIYLVLYNPQYIEHVISKRILGNLNKFKRNSLILSAKPGHQRQRMTNWETLFNEKSLSHRDLLLLTKLCLVPISSLVF